MRGPGGLREEREMKDSKSVGRRRFLSLAGAAGAGMALSKQATPAPAAEKPVAGWPTDFKPASTAPRWYPRDAPKPGEKIHEFDMELVLTRHEILPRVEHHAYAYNGTVPGPEIRVREGDWVKVNFTNKTHDFHTIHWRGMMLPNEMDGVPLGTQYPVGFNQFLIDDEQPTLIHTGFYESYDAVRAAVAQDIPPRKTA